MDLAKLVEQDGGVILSRYPERQNHIYIVGQLHERPQHGVDSLSVLPAEIEELDRAQFQLFRISRSIIDNCRVNLVLEEGVYRNEDREEHYREVRDLDAKLANKYGIESPNLIGNDDQLKKMIGLTHDALLLLVTTYSSLIVKGAEDEILSKASDVAVGLLQHIKNTFDSIPEETITYVVPRLFRLSSQINRKRSAKLLQNIPDIIEQEYNKGRIATKSALVHYGDAHLHELREFLEDGKIEIPGENGPFYELCQLLGFRPFFYDSSSMRAQLDLYKRGFGVSLIKLNSIGEEIKDPFKNALEYLETRR